MDELWHGKSARALQGAAVEGATSRARAICSYDALRHGAQDSMIGWNFTVSWGVEVLGLDLLGVVHGRLVAEFLESKTPGQGDLHQHVTREVLAIFGGAGRRE